jgi:hypothetical protein
VKDNSKRFWSKVDKSAGIDACWIWAARYKTRGYPYGVFDLRQGYVYTHRFAWELTFGSPDQNLCICHKCDNPKCVNPSHLFLGTHAENMQDMVQKKRSRTGCPKNSRRVGFGKLSDDDVRLIRLLREDGTPQSAIAERFNVNQSTVCRIYKGSRLGAVV